MNDEELLRYSRQIMLPEMDIAGQERLVGATVLIVGIGGLGSPAALYLAAAGVGHLILADHDHVDLSNLQRQIAHTTDAIGDNKAVSARVRIGTLNPTVKVTVISEKLTAERLTDLADQVTLVLDCTDNYASRYMLNDTCWRLGIALVSAAAIRWEGQLTVFDPNHSNSPCYRCLYPDASGENLNCAENGVAAPLVGMIGTAQAMEALKHICSIGDGLIGTVLYIDAKYMQIRRLGLSRRAGCPTCSP